MKALEQFLGNIKSYPFNERVPRALSGIICVLMGFAYHPKRISEADAFIVGALVIMVFCGPKGRPFWFFAGIIVGGLLIQAIPGLHSLFAR